MGVRHGLLPLTLLFCVPDPVDCLLLAVAEEQSRNIPELLVGSAGIGGQRIVLTRCFAIDA